VQTLHVSLSLFIVLFHVLGCHSYSKALLSPWLLYKGYRSPAVSHIFSINIFR
jgi:hypothetical protein